MAAKFDSEATLSAEVIRAMGFRPFEQGESITATFSSINVYIVRNLTLDSVTTRAISGTIKNVNYRIAVGAGLNDACMALINDIYTDTEDEWKKDKGATGPFILIQLGPTQEITTNAGNIKIETDGSATTLASFPGLRNELAAIEATALPLLVTALSCHPDWLIELRKIDRTSIGRSNTGQLLRDCYTRVQGELEFRSSRQVTHSEDCLAAVANLALRLDQKAARLFALGVSEDDEFKKFLYCFMSLEVQTHLSFKRIDHVMAVKKLINSASTAKPSTAELLRRQAVQFRSVFDRFVWCATSQWSNIDDADIQLFKKLKTVRDQISHGSISEPPSGYAQLAQQLATKVLGAQ